ncbi:MAG: hypothetical protein JWR38_702 [Mucilaginibacter sp.]|nr:hypothetical protein [Mucilaginibacter sp.]
MELDTLTNAIIKNKMVLAFCMILSVYFIFRFGKSMGELLYFITN